MNKSKLREQVELLVNKAWARGANWASKGYGYAMDTDAEQELEGIVKEVDQTLTTQKSELLEEVRREVNKLPDKQNAEFGEEVISRYDLLQKLSLLEGEK